MSGRCGDADVEVDMLRSGVAFTLVESENSWQGVSYRYNHRRRCHGRGWECRDQGRARGSGCGR